MHKISVVINVFNAENDIKQAVESVKWADEIVVVDDGSQDNTLKILQQLETDGYKLKVFKHQSVGFVEPARNFAISKAVNDWVLILDADECVPETLAARLQEIADKMEQIDYIRLPRKNIIFGHFMQYAGWWPDYNIRFFRKGRVKWVNQIHRPPEVSGEGIDLPAEEKYAIIHYNYSTISQFLNRMDRYTTIQAAELKKEGYKFNWQDLFSKPLNEFLSRFFVSQGYKDGLHGLALSLLQAFSFLVVYLKLWEMNKFSEQDISLSELKNQKDKSGQEIEYWVKKTNCQRNLFQRIFRK